MKLFAALAFVLCAQAAHAHQLLITVEARDGRLRVEAFHDDDTPASAARVELLADGKPIASGEADERGTWETALPADGRYQVVAESLGHRCERLIEVRAGSLRQLDAKSQHPASHAPSRVDQTQTPWKELLLGVVLIAITFGLVKMMMRRRFR